jgi:hypothetical protein
VERPCRIRADPHERRQDDPGVHGRLEAGNFAVYSDAIDPVTTATVNPAPNANGWNPAAVSVSLEATDLASGLNDTRAGWVDLLQYSLAGAQTGR